MSLFKKFILATILCLSLGGALQAQAFEIDDETKTIANLVISNIHSEIALQKDEFSDLKLFSQMAMKLNKEGIHEIYYYFKDPLKPKSRAYLEFYISILPIDQTTPYDDREGLFVEEFPILGLKTVVYQNISLKFHQVDITPLVKKHMTRFYDHQSTFLPVRLSLIPTKGSFQVGEPIEFTAILKNYSGSNMMVKELGSKSITFSYDDIIWGGNEEGSASARSVPLRPNRSTSTNFILPAPEQPRVINLHATYLLRVDGVLPTASMRINIIP